MFDFKVIVWDFDGVIIFSNPVREEGFREIFKEFSQEQVERLLDYHRVNGGLSRYVKIRYFYEEILGREITQEHINVLASDFSKVMLKKLGNQELLNREWLNFMETVGDNYIHHIASGSDGKELNMLCNSLGIAEYFQSINGSPTPKNQLVGDIISRNAYSKSDVVLIGDAINDHEAAMVNGIAFRGYNNNDLRRKGPYIDEFNELYE